MPARDRTASFGDATGDRAPPDAAAAEPDAAAAATEPNAAAGAVDPNAATDAADPASVATAAAVPARVAAAVGPGSCVGRYTVRERIGAGGMGEVFAAHDPELDRVVALKVLRQGQGSSTPEARARFQREAQAMARLNHPNVVSVHDVGLLGDGFFVAMELVEGPTLAAWMAERPRPWREVIALFLQAGRGLEAAHAAGMVHRDFKPSNVILGDRVRVADFGLARTAYDSEVSDGSGVSPLDAAITRTGLAVGTPAYMAPEQRAGKPVGPLSDQYSFAVALHEALTGARPGEPAPAGPPRQVPGWVRAVVERGLREEPAARYPSMRLLLADLARDPARTRRRWLSAAAALLLTGAAFWAVRARMGVATRDPCAADRDRFRGVWDEGAAAAVHDAFLATGEPYAEVAFGEAARQLDDSRRAWEAMRRDSCEATRVRRQQPDVVMDLRALCLERRFEELAAFTGELRKADVEAVRRAASQAAGIGDVAVCADADALGRRAPLPAAADRRAAIDAVERDLAAARARIAVGQVRAVAETTAGLETRARAADYPPLLAETLALAGAVAAETGAPAEAEKLFDEAALAAEAGGDDWLRFDVEVRLFRVVGYQLERADDGAAHAQRAVALQARLGPDLRRAALLATAQTNFDWGRGRYDEARAEAGQAIDLWERIDPNSAGMARALHLRAVIEDDTGETEAALATEQRALAIGRRALGEMHPDVGNMWSAISGPYRRLRRYDEARDAGRRALAIYEAVYGPDAELAGNAVANLAIVDLDEKKPEQAIPGLRRALAIYEKANGPEHSRTAQACQLLGDALSQAGHSEEAEAILQRALAIYRARFGDDNPFTAGAHRSLGKHYLRVDRSREARDAFRAAVHGIEASQGPDSPMLATSLMGQGDAEMELHDPAAAIPLYERALPLANEGLAPGVKKSLAEARRQAHAAPR